MTTAECVRMLIARMPAESLRDEATGENLEAEQYQLPGSAKAAARGAPSTNKHPGPAGSERFWWTREQS